MRIIQLNNDLPVCLLLQQDETCSVVLLSQLIIFYSKTAIKNR
jgi:hypothetical protein